MTVEDAITAGELLRRYRAGQRVFRNLDISDDPERPLEGVDLSGIDLSECFVACSFAHANLTDARLQANLKTCDFSHANLKNADFRSAALCATTFEQATMEGANFEDAYYHGFDLGASDQPDW